MSDLIATLMANAREDLPAKLARLRKNTPKALTERRQWVVWRYEQRNGKPKPTKILYQAPKVRRPAKSSDPATWCDFKTALVAFENFKDIAGVGFVFSEDDGFVGIDIDNCVDADGQLNDVAQDIVQRLKSYTEFSPSSEGVHIIARGTLEGLEGSRRNSVEMYESGRYFTVTGDRLPRTNSVISGEQKMLEAVHALYVQKPKTPSQASKQASPPNITTQDYDKRLEALKRHAKAARLFAGDVSAYTSPSEADQALANYCAFYFAGDVGMMARAMNESALKREKWANVHDGEGGRTYLQMTLDTALADFDGKGYEPSRYSAAARAVNITAKNESGLLFETASDRANAIRLEAFFGEHVFYTPWQGKDAWLLYDDQRGVFKVDKQGTKILGSVQDDLDKIVRLELADIYAQSADAKDEADKKEADKQAVALAAWLKKCNQAATIERSVKLLKGRKYADHEKFDAYPWLFACQNGVLDLKSGELLPHSPDFKLTQRSNVVYDPTAQHDHVDALVTLLEQDNRADTLQRALGSCLSGFAPNEKLFLLVGQAATGKSTLLEAVLQVLGDYGANVDTAQLVGKRQAQAGTARPDLVRLRGKRLVVGGELPKNERLNSSEIKAQTGRDVITARALHSGEYIAFEPTYKLFVHSNFDPLVDWNDSGIQRRLLRVPFNAKPEQIDPTFKNVLKYDQRAQSALLNWLLAGLRAWLRDGFDLAESETIREAIAEFQRESNPFSAFGEDVLRFEPRLKTSTHDLWRAYKGFCDSYDLRPQRQRDLGEYLKSKGCEQRRERINGKQVRLWQGVGLQS